MPSQLPSASHLQEKCALREDLTGHGEIDGLYQFNFEVVHNCWGKGENGRGKALLLACNGNAFCTGVRFWDGEMIFF